MAVGKTNRFPAGKAFTARVSLKDGNEFRPVPEFTFQAKDATGEYNDLTPEQINEAFGVDGPIRDIAGDLIALDTRVGQYDGDPIHNVTLGLRDADRNEVIFTQFVSNNNFGRGIANRLLNLAKRDEAGNIVSVNTANVQFGLYSQLNKELKKSFAAASIRQGESTDTIKYFYDPKTAPEVQPRLFEGKGGKQEKDYTKVDEFLFAELGKLGEFLKANRSNKQEAPKSAPQSQAAPENPTPAPSGETTEEPPPF